MIIRLISILCSSCISSSGSNTLEIGLSYSVLIGNKNLFIISQIHFLDEDGYHQNNLWFAPIDISMETTMNVSVCCEFSCGHYNGSSTCCDNHNVRTLG